MTADRPDLRSLDEDALVALAIGMGEPAFRGRQLFKWVHEKGATSFDDMTDLPLALRERLTETARLGALVETRRQRATDRTVKSLFRLPSGRHVEAVLIPDLALMAILPSYMPESIMTSTFCTPKESMVRNSCASRSSRGTTSATLTSFCFASRSRSRLAANSGALRPRVGRDFDLHPEVRRQVAGNSVRDH